MPAHSPVALLLPRIIATFDTATPPSLVNSYIHHWRLPPICPPCIPRALPRDNMPATHARQGFRFPPSCLSRVAGASRGDLIDTLSETVSESIAENGRTHRRQRRHSCQVASRPGSVSTSFHGITHERSHNVYERPHDLRPIPRILIIA